MAGADPSIVLQPGSRLGKYVVVRQIGVGGMGAVFEGTHDKLRKRVAIKVIHPHLALANPATISRFLREGEAAASIVHPNVVTVDDVGVENGVPFLAMEYLEGEDLGATLAREKRLALERAVDLLLPVISAIGSAHERGIVHRDLKPENIFLCRGGGGSVVPKVLDFGISKLSNSHADLKLTGTNALLGTPYYMSPEQAGGKKDLDARSDIFSLGVILYLCLTGSLPFPGTALLDVLMAIAHEEPPALSSKEPSVPAEFERIVGRAMAKSPAARFQTARELGAALLPYASQRARLNYEHEFGVGVEPAAPRVPVTTQPGVTPVPPWPAGTFDATAQSPGSKSRRVWPAVSVVLVVAGAAAGVSVLLLRGSPPPEPPLSPAPSGEMRPLAPQPSAAPGPVITPALAATIEIAPADAVVKLDGRVVQGRPVTVELTGSEHVLEVEAEGYEAKRATFADDPPQRIVLEKAPDKPVKTAQAARPGTKKPAGSAHPTAAAAPQVKPAAAGAPKPQTGANDAIILR